LQLTAAQKTIKGDLKDDCTLHFLFSEPLSLPVSSADGDTTITTATKNIQGDPPDAMPRPEVDPASLDAACPAQIDPVDNAELPASEAQISPLMLSGDEDSDQESAPLHTRLAELRLDDRQPQLDGPTATASTIDQAITPDSKDAPGSSPAIATPSVRTAYGLPPDLDDLDDSPEVAQEEIISSPALSRVESRTYLESLIHSPGQTPASVPR
jgi:hypothetical protein